LRGEHVVGVELVDREDVDVREVAQRLPGDVVLAREHDERRAALREACEGRERGLRRRRLAETEALDDVHATGAGAVRERTAQRGSLHLLGGALAVVARHGAVHDAAARELRGAHRALTGAAGALLAVRLAATTTDLATRLDRVGALARRGELRHDDLVDEGDVGLDVEELAGQLGRAGLLALGVHDVDGHVLGHVSLTHPSRRYARARRRPWGRGWRP